MFPVRILWEFPYRNPSGWSLAGTLSLISCRNPLADLLQEPPGWSLAGPICRCTVLLAVHAAGLCAPSPASRTLQGSGHRDTSNARDPPVPHGSLTEQQESSCAAPLCSWIGVLPVLTVHTRRRSRLRLDPESSCPIPVMDIFSPTYTGYWSC